MEYLIILEAVHCYHESCRRLFVDFQPERLHIKEENTRKTKIRTRQRQVYYNAKCKFRHYLISWVRVKMLYVSKVFPRRSKVEIFAVNMKVEIVLCHKSKETKNILEANMILET